MSRVTNVYSAHFVGSAGYGTFKLLRGQTIFSQKSLGPTNERTDIQIGNEKSMATLVAAGRPIKGGIDRGFNEKKVKNKPTKCANTAWGAYIGENRKYENDVFDYTVPDIPVFNPENFIAAKGTIFPTEMTTVTMDVSLQDMALTWPITATDPGQSPFDLLQIVVYNETTDTWGVVTVLGLYFTAYRIDGGISTIPSPVPFILTDVVRVYTFFQGQTNDLYPTTPFIFTGKESDSTNMIATITA